MRFRINKNGNIDKTTAKIVARLTEKAWAVLEPTLRRTDLRDIRLMLHYISDGLHCHTCMLILHKQCARAQRGGTGRRCGAATHGMAQEAAQP